MDLELTGKTAIITGGSRGIGKAVGREFGREGMNVALVARGQEALEETARELAEETGANFITILADTGDPESVKAMVKEAAEKLGRIDILVNSAARVGGAFTPKLAEITEEEMQYFYEVDALDLAWMVENQPGFEEWSERMRGHMSGRMRASLDDSPAESTWAAVDVKGFDVIDLVFLFLGLATAFWLGRSGLRRRG